MEIFQDLKDIVIEGELIGEIKYKPGLPMYIMIVVAFALLFVPLTAARILAVFVMAIDAFVMFKVKDRKVAGVYSNCVLVYDADGEKAVKILNTDIEQYDLGINEQYKLAFTLYDGRSIKKETFRMDQAKKYLKIALPHKISQEVQHEKNKNKKLDPIKGFKKLFGIKTKKKGEDK